MAKNRELNRGEPVKLASFGYGIHRSDGVSGRTFAQSSEYLPLSSIIHLDIQELSTVVMHQYRSLIILVNGGCTWYLSIIIHLDMPELLVMIMSA